MNMSERTYKDEKQVQCCGGTSPLRGRRREATMLLGGCYWASFLTEKVGKDLSGPF